MLLSKKVEPVGLHLGDTRCSCGSNFGTDCVGERLFPCLKSKGSSPTYPRGTTKPS